MTSLSSLVENYIGIKMHTEEVKRVMQHKTSEIKKSNCSFFGSICLYWFNFYITMTQHNTQLKHLLIRFFFFFAEQISPLNPLQLLQMLTCQRSSVQPHLKLQMFCSNFPLFFSSSQNQKTIQENYDREFIIGQIKLGSAGQQYIVL